MEVSMSKTKNPAIVARFRSAYDGLNDGVSSLYSITYFSPSRTIQSAKAECDINNVMAKYRLTGLAKVSANYKSGMYADLASRPEFHDAMNIIAKSNESFAALPSSLRKRFSNDPSEFLDFVSDPANLDEMVNLGILHRRPDPVQPAAASVEGSV